MQVKLPVGWLMQRPRGPQTLDETCCTPSESLEGTATMQLSITVKEKAKHSLDFFLFNLVSFSGLFHGGVVLRSP